MFSVTRLSVLLFSSSILLSTSARASVLFDLSLDHASVPQDGAMIDAGSKGREDLRMLRMPPSPSQIDNLFMSVDRVAVGAPGSAVNQQAGPPRESAHGDIYAITWPHAQRHLVTVCETASGPLPPPAAYFHERFGGLPLPETDREPATVTN